MTGTPAFILKQRLRRRKHHARSLGSGLGSPASYRVVAAPLG